MKVEIDLDKDLEKYFEYIPNELINTVVLSLLKEAVRHKSSVSLKQESSQSLSDLEGMLSRLLQQQSTEHVETSKLDTSFKETTVEFSETVVADVDLGDLDDFMDFMK